MITILNATEEHLWAIKQIANRYPKELGYVMWPALRESLERGTLLIALDDSLGVVGFVNYYPRKDNWFTIREIAVITKNTGVGSRLIDAVPRPIKLKCPVDSEANTFYEHLGFTCVDIEEGRKRALNVWVKL